MALRYTSCTGYFLNDVLFSFDYAEILLLNKAILYFSLRFYSLCLIFIIVDDL